VPSAIRKPPNPLPLPLHHTRGGGALIKTEGSGGKPHVHAGERDAVGRKLTFKTQKGLCRASNPFEGLYNRDGIVCDWDLGLGRLIVL